MQNHFHITLDQMGFEVKIPHSPSIISLVPSQTELLFELGLEDQIVGLTKFCVHPADQVKEKAIIGGTKKFRFDIIDQLKPDLIIGNKEENYKEGIDRLKEKHSVWMSDISILPDAIEMIKQVGQISGASKKAEKLADQILQRFKNIEKRPSKKTLYFIWKKPYMVVGHGTFINDMLSRIGLTNLVNELPRYPELTTAMIKALQPELILLSSEPYPFKEEHLLEFKEICPDAEVKIVDGEMFSWYGSRLLKSVDYFNQLSF